MAEPVVVIDEIGGQCPMQAEGTVDGERFYFRSRGNAWRLTVYDGARNEWYHEQRYGHWPDAGWIDEAEARTFIGQAAALYIIDRDAEKDLTASERRARTLSRDADVMDARALRELEDDSMGHTPAWLREFSHAQCKRRSAGFSHEAAVLRGEATGEMPPLPEDEAHAFWPAPQVVMEGDQPKQRHMAASLFSLLHVLVGDKEFDQERAESLLEGLELWVGSPLPENTALHAWHEDAKEVFRAFAPWSFVALHKAAATDQARSFIGHARRTLGFLASTEPGMAGAMTTEDKLEGFCGLPLAPSDASLELARRVLRTYADAGLVRTDAFAGGEGEVMVTAYADGSYIETDIEPSLVMSFLHEDGKGETLDEVTTLSIIDIGSAVRKAVKAMSAVEAPGNGTVPTA